MTGLGLRSEVTAGSLPACWPAAAAAGWWAPEEPPRCPDTRGRPRTAASGVPPSTPTAEEEERRGRSASVDNKVWFKSARECVCVCYLLCVRVEGHGEVQQQLPLLHALDEGLWHVNDVNTDSQHATPTQPPPSPLSDVPACGAPGLGPPGRSPPLHTLRTEPAGPLPPGASPRWCRCSDKQREVSASAGPRRA